MDMPLRTSSPNGLGGASSQAIRGGVKTDAQLWPELARTYWQLLGKRPNPNGFGLHRRNHDLPFKHQDSPHLTKDAS